MATHYNGPSWRETGAQPRGLRQLPYIQTHRRKKLSKRHALWRDLVQHSNYITFFVRCATKISVLFLIMAFGLTLVKPAMADGPVFGQLAAGLNINKIIKSGAIAETQETASASAQSNQTLYKTLAKISVESSEALSAESSASDLAYRDSESSDSESNNSAYSDSEASDSESSDLTSTNTTSDESSDSWVYKGSTGCCSWPVRGRITSRVTRWHMAVDIASPYWTPVQAADGGRIIAAGWDRSGYGYRVIIDHGRGLTTLYAHLSRYYYDYGDYVNKGMTIGRVGSTGYSSGPHLHFEVRVHNYRQNPWNWLP